MNEGMQDTSENGSKLYTFSQERTPKQGVRRLGLLLAKGMQLAGSTVHTASQSWRANRAGPKDSTKPAGHYPTQ